ncbi:hypothetical protein H9P43_010009 [Blastocladiella emersonii ATCC 22665]|nr:hypothetical protein H9P43_010009 [Blastocladiella emersonii ATCC 22665]
MAPAPSATSRTELPDYYATLQVAPSAAFKDILAAYQREALRLHPDLHPKDGVTDAAFALVNEAYVVLSDPTRRKKYDAARGRLLAVAGPDRPAGTTINATVAAEVQRAFTQFLGVNLSVLDVFDEVFEPLIAEELEHDEDGTVRAKVTPASTSTGWSYTGALSASVLGFIIGNVPGAIVGGMAGYKLGQVRDKSGKAVIEVWRDLDSHHRQTVLGRLARKLIF